jgi:hypothetical protein
MSKVLWLTFTLSGVMLCGILWMFTSAEGILDHQVKERAKLVLHMVWTITNLAFNTTSICKKKSVNVPFLLLSFIFSSSRYPGNRSNLTTHSTCAWYSCMCDMHKIKIHHWIRLNVLKSLFNKFENAFSVYSNVFFKNVIFNFCGKVWQL